MFNTSDKVVLFSNKVIKVKKDIFCRTKDARLFCFKWAMDNW